MQINSHGFCSRAARKHLGIYICCSREHVGRYFNEARVLQNVKRKHHRSEAAILKALNNKGLNRKAHKFKWPKEALSQIPPMRLLAESQDAKDYVYERIRQVLTWPDSKFCDLDHFYAKPGEKLGKRDKQWFKAQSLTIYKLEYSFTDAWDKQPVSVDFAVPDDIDPRKEIPIVWSIHGGGGCTGAGDFIPWKSAAATKHTSTRNAITIYINYSLGPECNHGDVANWAFDYLWWFNDDEMLDLENGYPSQQRWTNWLMDKIGKGPLNFNKKRVHIEGKSAGGAIAVSLIFINASNDGPKIPIKSALLRFPMIEHYDCSKLIVDGLLDYMGEKFDLKNDDDKTKIEEAALRIEELIGILEYYHACPSKTERTPPVDMATAFLQSVTGRWKGSFQREHGPHKAVRDLPGNWSGIERAENSVNMVDHSLLPPIIMYHGSKDANCPFSDTEKFKNILTANYPMVYTEDKTLFLFEFSGKQHAFDYGLTAEGDEQIKRVYDQIEKLWLS